MSTVLLHGARARPRRLGRVRDALGDVVVPALPRDPRGRSLSRARWRVPGSVLVGHSMGGVLALRLAVECAPRAVVADGELLPAGAERTVAGRVAAGLRRAPRGVRAVDGAAGRIVGELDAGAAVARRARRCGRAGSAPAVTAAAGARGATRPSRPPRARCDFAAARQRGRDAPRAPARCCLGRCDGTPAPVRPEEAVGPGDATRDRGERSDRTVGPGALEDLTPEPSEPPPHSPRR